jgi:hypothetical protein
MMQKLTILTTIGALSVISGLTGYWLGVQGSSSAKAALHHQGETARLTKADQDQTSASPSTPESRDQAQLLRRELDSVKAQLVSERAAHAEALARSEGTPIPWSPDIPEKFHEEAFRTTLSKALESCAPASELMALECNEYPCIAALRSEHANLVDCTPWLEAYDDTSRITNDLIQCPDGHQESVVFISPFYDRGPNEGIAKRAEARWRNLKDSWQCAPPS